MGWRRMKGMIKAVNKCPKCHGLFPDDEYSFEDDLCLFCLFPETGNGRQSANIDKFMGYARSQSDERIILDNLDFIPEKQSDKALKKQKAYKKAKIYK